MDNKIYKVKASIAFVHRNNLLEVFLTNSREQVLLEIDYDAILNLISEFNGSKTVGEIYKNWRILDYKDFCNLIIFLNNKYIFIEKNHEYSLSFFKKNYRLISFLEDFCLTTQEVMNCIEKLNSKTVLIIGMGAVGTWIADGLVRTGVKNFIFVDDDKVELSNLHRQNLFFENDVGKFKVDVAKDNLRKITECNISVIKEKFNESFFLKNNIIFDLAINCADYPSVDYTSKVLADECMLKNIPHIIGGGYNLHLTLIGQTIIPNETSCFYCFDSFLKKINNLDLNGVKKLNRENRKIGSFGPLCAISASLASLDAIKVLIGKTNSLNNSNKRIEFIVKDRDFKILEISRSTQCHICGDWNEK